MKLKHSLTIALLAVTVPAAAPAQAPAKPSAPGAGAPQAAPAPAFTDAQLVEEAGWIVAKRNNLTELQFTNDQVDAIVKGFATAMNGKDSPYDLQKMEPALNAFMQGRQTAALERLKEKGKSEAAGFFAQLKDNKNVVELPSGLRYEILKQGQGDSPKPTETVVVHYTGKLIDGSVFDSSVQRGQPAEFELDQVIPGWTEGIQKIGKGGRIKLYIPANLAYGDEGRPGIPPGSALVFEVELLDIKATPPPKG